MFFGSVSSDQSTMIAFGFVFFSKFAKQYKTKEMHTEPVTVHQIITIFCVPTVSMSTRG